MVLEDFGHIPAYISADHLIAVRLIATQMPDEIEEKTADQRAELTLYQVGFYFLNGTELSILFTKNQFNDLWERLRDDRHNRW